MLTVNEGKKLIELARAAVEKHHVDVKGLDRQLLQRKGVFVSVYSWPDKNLRGCIGFVNPEVSLWKAVQEAALSAAFADPRFPPLKPEDLKQVVFEVSVLDEPKPIQVERPEEYEQKIEVGKDGLILEHPPFSGLFLPQVWMYFDTVHEFLENLCYKASLTPDYIQHPNTKLLKFHAQVFAEQEPEGKVVEVKGSFRKR